MSKIFSWFIVAVAVAGLFTGSMMIGCGGGESEKTEKGKKQTSSVAPKDMPKMVLANSIYTSWNTYFITAAVLDEDGEMIADPREGYIGSLEKKWGVDLVVLDQEYTKTIETYGNSNCDAVTMTNMDAVAPAASRKSVVIMPNSTSYGADALAVADKIKTMDDLKSAKVYVLEKSVEEYCWWRGLNLMKLDPKAFKFENKDPESIAPAMQQMQIDAGFLWNPLLRATLNSRKDIRVMFDSTLIPGEIIDTVVVGQDYMDKPHGKSGACLLIDIYYTINQHLADEKTHSKTMKLLGSKFGNLDEAAMADLVRQTRFFATPEQGIALFTKGVVFPWPQRVNDTRTLFTNVNFDPKGFGVTNKTLKDVMPIVMEFNLTHDMVKDAVKVGYGTKSEAPDAQLRFDPSFMKDVADFYKK